MFFTTLLQPNCGVGLFMLVVDGVLLGPLHNQKAVDSYKAAIEEAKNLVWKSLTHLCLIFMRPAI